MGLVARLQEFARGYVIFRVVGEGVERFANLSARHGVNLRAFRRLGPRVAVGRAYARDFRRLRRPAALSRVQLRLVRRGGLPFLGARLARRPGVVVGALVALALVGVLGSRVWEVQVTGLAPAEAREVEQVLARLGLRPGVARSRVNPDEIERVLLLEAPRLAWVDVRLQGAVARVDVRPRRDEQREALQSGDIVAARDGLVTQVLVASGWPLVQAGDVVRRGQVLISGRPLTPGAYEDRALRARGWVRARVWSEGYGESRLWVGVDRPTGRDAVGLAVRVGPWRLNVGAVAPPFARYRSRVASYRLPGPVASLPVSLDWVRHHEIERLRIPVDRERARRLAEEAAREQAAAGLGPSAEILRVDRQLWEENSPAGPVVRCRILVEAVLDIGRFEPHPVAGATAPQRLRAAGRTPVQRE